MANYENLKSAIQQVVKTNGNNAITGALLQQSLLAIINSLGAGYQFIGVATPTTNPGTPDKRVFYMASTAGTYTNFGGLEVTEDEVVVLTWDSSWRKTQIWTISDLDAIRQGAEKGSTALQSESDPIYTADKPNLALKSELDGKVDKEDGKGLSSNDYTDAEKAKLSELEEEATNIRTDVFGKDGEIIETTIALQEQSGKYYGEDGELVTGSGYYQEIDLSEYAGSKLHIVLTNKGTTSGRYTLLISNGVIVNSFRETRYEDEVLWDIPVNAVLKVSHSTSSSLSLWAEREIAPVLSKIDIVHMPYNFSWRDNPLKDKIHFGNGGRITVDLDISGLKNESGVTYYVSPFGDDSNDGLSREHPLTTIRSAIKKDDVGTIVLMDGIYNIYRVPSTFTKSLNIIADENAHPIIVTARSSTWSLVSGYTNIYSNPNIANQVVDITKKDAFGNYKTFVPVSSMSLLEETPNSFLKASDGTYINVGEQPQVGEVYPLENNNAFVANYSNNEKLYIEGITILGSQYGVKVTNLGNGNPKFIANRCYFGNSSAGNGLTILGMLSICKDCVCAYNIDDGFNYHKQDSAIPYAIEINCIGMFNGREDNTDNGTTMHDGGKIVRVNGGYHHNVGPNVADTAECESVNINCIAHSSKGLIDSIQNNGFRIDGDGARMWLLNCVAYKNTRDAYARNQASMFIGQFVGGIDTDDTSDVIPL